MVKISADYFSLLFTDDDDNYKNNFAFVSFSIQVHVLLPTSIPARTLSFIF
jgi:hypothetical protein